MHHLQILKEEFTSCFPEYGQGQAETEVCTKLIRNPFRFNRKNLPDDIQEDVIELQYDCNFRDWIESGRNHMENSCGFLSKSSTNCVTVFSTTFLCKQGFFTLIMINKGAKKSARRNTTVETKPVQGSNSCRKMILTSSKTVTVV